MVALTTLNVSERRCLLRRSDGGRVWVWRDEPRDGALSGCGRYRRRRRRRSDGQSDCAKKRLATNTVVREEERNGRLQERVRAQSEQKQMQSAAVWAAACSVGTSGTGKVSPTQTKRRWLRLSVGVACVLPAGPALSPALVGTACQSGECYVN